MLKGEAQSNINIIMIPFHDCKKWIAEGFRTRDAHLAEHFCLDSRVNKILVINRPTSLAEILKNREGWRITDGASDVSIQIECVRKKFQISKLNEKLFCLDIYVPEFLEVAFERKLWWYSAFQSETTIEIIKLAVNYLKLRNPVLFLQNPMAIGAVASLDYNCFAFDAIDNWLYHPQMRSNHNIISQNYSYVKKNADIIFTVSEALRDETFEGNQNVYWIPNGVDTEFFARSIRDYTDNDPITVVYAGKIQDRVDFELVEMCLTQYTDVNFMFLGPIYAQKDKTRKLQRKYHNISFLGDIHYSKLPDVLRLADIAIIPHKVDSFTESMNPLKLYEYLAGGKPVVSTEVAGVSGISEYVYVASKEKFPAILGDIILKVKCAIIKSAEVAASVPDECTWKNRSSEILELIDKALAENG